MTKSIAVLLGLSDDDAMALEKFKLNTHADTDEAVSYIVSDRLRAIRMERRLVPREVEINWANIGVALDEPKHNTQENPKMLTNAQKWDFIKDGFEVIPCANESWVLRNLKRLDPGAKQDISSSVAFSTFGQLIAFLDDARTGNEPFVST